MYRCCWENKLSFFLSFFLYFSSIEPLPICMKCTVPTHRKSTINPEKSKVFNQNEETLRMENSKRYRHKKLYLLSEFMHSAVNLPFCGSKCTFIIYLLFIYPPVGLHSDDGFFAALVVFLFSFRQVEAFSYISLQWVCWRRVSKDDSKKARESFLILVPWKSPRYNFCNVADPVPFWPLDPRSGI